MTAKNWFAKIPLSYRWGFTGPETDTIQATQLKIPGPGSLATQLLLCLFLLTPTTRMMRIRCDLEPQLKLAMVPAYSPAPGPLSLSLYFHTEKNPTYYISYIIYIYIKKHYQPPKLVINPRVNHATLQTHNFQMSCRCSPCWFWVPPTLAD